MIFPEKYEVEKSFGYFALDTSIYLKEGEHIENRLVLNKVTVSIVTCRDA